MSVRTILPGLVLDRASGELRVNTRALLDFMHLERNAANEDWLRDVIFIVLRAFNDCGPVELHDVWGLPPAGKLEGGEGVGSPCRS